MQVRLGGAGGGEGKADGYVMRVGSGRRRVGAWLG